LIKNLKAINFYLKVGDAVPIVAKWWGMLKGRGGRERN
jgi:hypothetical protein